MSAVKSKRQCFMFGDYSGGCTTCIENDTLFRSITEKKLELQNEQKTSFCASAEERNERQQDSPSEELNTKPQSNENLMETKLEIQKIIDRKTPLYIRAIYTHEEGVHPISHTWRLPSHWDPKLEESRWWKESISFHFLRQFIEEREQNYLQDDGEDEHAFEGLYNFLDFSNCDGIVPDIEELETASQEKIKQLEELDDDGVAVLKHMSVGKTLERRLLFIRVMNEWFQPVKRACDGEIIMITVPDGEW